MPHSLDNQFKITKDLLESCKEKCNKFVGRNKTTGYLLYETIDDRLNDLFSCHVYRSPTGTILLNDQAHILPYAVKYHTELNSHAILIRTSYGFHNDDFANNMRTASLTFSFSKVAGLLDSLGI